MKSFYPFLTYKNTNITDMETCCSAGAGAVAIWPEEVNIAGTVQTPPAHTNRQTHTYMLDSKCKTSNQLSKCLKPQ